MLDMKCYVIMDLLSDGVLVKVVEKVCSIKQAISILQMGSVNKPTNTFYYVTILQVFTIPTLLSTTTSFAYMLE